MSDHVILIPVFNEARTVDAIVARARRYGSVLVVDDGSTDGSAGVAESAGAEVIRLTRRGGKGAALRRGLAEAVARGALRVVTMDGDGQHDPDEIPHLLAAALAAPDALVIGGRLGVGPFGDAPHDGMREPGATTSTVIPASRMNAMRVAGFFIDWLTGAPLADTQSGFRVYPAGLIAVTAPRRGGFVFETEILLQAAAAGWPLRETPVTPIHSDTRRSRFRPVQDGVAVGTYLAREVLRRLAREAVAQASGLLTPFRAARRRLRHQELATFLLPYRHNPGGFATAFGVFFLHRTAETWRNWWDDRQTRRLGLVGAAVALAPVLLVLSILQIPLGRIGVDVLGPFIWRWYSQGRLRKNLARAATPPRAPEYDVLVVGGGPGGSTAATLLAQGGLSVGLVEREAFPRFRVGESLIPNCMPILERMGVLDRVRAHGFQPKYGVSIHDQELALEHSFYFREGRPWPSFTYDVHRAEFDEILIDHAAKLPGVTLLQPTTVERVAFDALGVTARVNDAAGPRDIRARFLVDASGRDALLTSRQGRRQPMPGDRKSVV